MKNLFESAALPPHGAGARRTRTASQTVLSASAPCGARQGPRRAGALRSYSKVLRTLSILALTLALQAGGRQGFAAVSGGSAAGGRVASEVTTDWPGCGGVCGVRIETDYLVLDMSSAPAPSATLRITLTLVLWEASDEGSSSSFDVSSVLRAGQSGVLSVSGAVIPGGTGNVASAVLSWVDPATGAEGKEEVPLY